MAVYIRPRKLHFAARVRFMDVQYPLIEHYRNTRPFSKIFKNASVTPLLFIIHSTAEDAEARMLPSGEHPEHLLHDLPLAQEDLQCIVPEDGAHFKGRATWNMPPLP